MKKLLLCVLAAFAFVGITGCASETKMSAEEAQKTLNEASLNTEKKLGQYATIKYKDGVSASIKSNEIKGTVRGTEVQLIDKSKINTSANASGSVTYNIEEKKAKVSLEADGKIDANITSGFLKSFLSIESPKKITYTAKAKGDAYLIDGEEKTNLYVDYNAEINDQIAKDFDIEQTKYSGKYNFSSVMIHGFINKDDDEDETETDTSTTTFDFDFIKDWTIFKKKGNLIIADCSNLDAFDLGEDFKEAQKELKEIGLEFKVSKCQFELNKDKTIKNADFALSASGNLDLSKTEFDSDELVPYISMVDKDLAEKLNEFEIRDLKGNMEVNFNASAKVEFNYDKKDIVVPDDLKNIEEKSIDGELFGLAIGFYSLIG